MLFWIMGTLLNIKRRDAMDKRQATPFHLLINILSFSMRYLDELPSVSASKIIGPCSICMVFSSTGTEKYSKRCIIFYCLGTQASLFASCFVSACYLVTTLLASELLYSYDVREVGITTFTPNNFTSTSSSSFSSFSSHQLVVSATEL